MNARGIASGLFRGDHHPRQHNGRSMPLDRFDTAGLFTNLIAGGDPLAIRPGNFHGSIIQHVAGATLSHYLSFTSDRAVAEAFAMGLLPGAQEIENGTVYLEPWEENDGWDSAVFSIALSQFDVSDSGNGFYRLANTHPRAGQTHFLLVDVVTFVEFLIRDGSHSNLDSLLEQATIEAEWLLFPLDPMPDGVGSTANIPPHLFTAERFQRVPPRNS